MAIIELKFKPWESVRWEDDLTKLKRFEVECNSENILKLGWKTVSSNWNEQSIDTELKFKLNKNTLFGFFVGASNQAAAVNKLDSKDLPLNFLHLAGYLDDDKKPYFEEVAY